MDIDLAARASAPFVRFLNTVLSSRCDVYSIKERLDRVIDQDQFAPGYLLG